MAVVGIDYLCNDISAGSPLRRGGFIEVNSVPQMNASRAPILLDALFPSDHRARIRKPDVVLVDGARFRHFGKVRILQEAMKHPEIVVAVSQSGPVAEALLARMPTLSMRAYRHPNEVLLDATLQRCVFVLDLKEFERRGLPFPRPTHLSLLMGEANLRHPATRIFLDRLRGTQVQAY
jgi:hypothetical protein